VTYWSVGVVIPARDEEDHLCACLESVRRAADRVEQRGHRVEVVVVADACRDATAALAEAMVQGWGAVLAVEIGSAGGARAAGVRAYLARQDRALDSTWLASTDADTVVPQTWLDHQLGLARLGVAGVAGIVAVDAFTDHPAHVPARWAGLYDGPLDDPHPHIHGANLGLRADAYLAVGGWAVLEQGEDRRLWAALQDAGYPVASPRSLVVTTSGRATSRVRGGFADSLNVLGEAS
jgi:cellulose synthase/poly-beta-1,6-N-acetylglucosamine synthase-like glycosyltransferase